MRKSCFCFVRFRKKKKNKESKHRLEQVATSQNDEETKAKKAYVDKRTPAQIAFDKMQEKRVSLMFLFKCMKLNFYRKNLISRLFPNYGLNHMFGFVQKCKIESCILSFCHLFELKYVVVTLKCLIFTNNVFFTYLLGLK